MVKRKTLVGHKRQYAALLVAEGYSDSEICKQLGITSQVLQLAKDSPNFPKVIAELTQFMKTIRAGREARASGAPDHRL
jgi:hypothetical protein